MEANNKKAIRMTNILEAAFPELEIHCPARMDEFVLEAFLAGEITEKAILEVDCRIIKKKDLLLIYNWQYEFSSGMKIEFDFAIENNIPYLIFENSIDEAIELIENYLRKNRC